MAADHFVDKRISQLNYLSALRAHQFTDQELQKMQGVLDHLTFEENLQRMHYRCLPTRLRRLIRKGY